MSDTTLMLEELRRAGALNDVNKYVKFALERTIYPTSRQVSIDTLSFFSNYARWNNAFGPSVAILAGTVALSGNFNNRSVYEVTRDSSSYVSSFFFDAARDEFNDSSTRERDTHQCLSKAFLQGLIDYLKLDIGVADEVMAPSYDITEAGQHVLKGYLGELFTSDREENLFGRSSFSIYRGIGFHLGSELFASQEFTIMDTMLRARFPQLVEFLESHTVELNGVKHNCYAWIKFHSGLGRAVEEDHFNLALEGAQAAIDMSSNMSSAYNYIMEGYLAFGRHHRMVFNSLTRSIDVTTAVAYEGDV